MYLWNYQQKTTLCIVWTFLSFSSIPFIYTFLPSCVHWFSKGFWEWLSHYIIFVLDIVWDMFDTWHFAIWLFSCFHGISYHYVNIFLYFLFNFILEISGDFLVWTDTLWILSLCANLWACLWLLPFSIYK